MPDIVLLDGRGEPTTYSDIKTVEFDTTDGNRAKFYNMTFVDRTVEADFSNGDMVVSTGPDEALETVTIHKSDNFVPGNIRKGEVICGIKGTMEGAAAPPAIGFVPSEWNGQGFFTKGAWYGNTIPNQMFGNSYKIGPYITELEIKNNITQLGTQAFIQCSNLRSIDFSGSTFSEIPNETFYECSSLTEIDFPPTLKKIGNQGFTRCTKLVTATLPEGFESLGPYAFYGDVLLQLTSIPSSVKILDNYCFFNCQSITCSSLPEGLEKIGTCAFYSCSRVISMRIPSTVETVGGDCFYSCSGLKEVVFKGTPTSIANRAFGACSNLTSIKVPWSEGEVASAPWGASNATITYNYTE